MDRIGAGFIAVLAAIMFAMFDLTASILVLLGFLIFRWAVIAAPILGTVGLLRPASAGIRRLGNAVVAAIFNIAIFGTGAAIYLFAVDLIMNTASLARLAAGRAGLALRRRRLAAAAPLPADHPARRQGRHPGDRLRRFLASPLLPRHAGGRQAGDRRGRRHPRAGDRQERPHRLCRPEQPASRGAPGGSGTLARAAASSTVERRPEPSRRRSRPDGSESVPRARAGAGAARPPAAPGPARPRRPSTWTEPDVAEQPASYAIYRPETGSTTREPATPRVRSEAK